jgi:hypothetical protein
MEIAIEQTVLTPPKRCCDSCGKLLQFRAVQVVEHLMTKQEVRRIVETSIDEANNSDPNKVKAALEQFDQFEYYALAYRCPTGHIAGTRYDWQYTQEDAQLAAQLLNEEICP